MSLVQSICASFLYESWLGIHDLTSDNLKAALFGSSRSLNSDTTAYSSTGEVSGTGYSSGGKLLTGVQVQLIDGVVCFTCDNIEWTLSTITARSMLIYNSSKANRSIGVLDFGADKSSAGNTFRVKPPPFLASKALLRLTTYRG